MEGSDFLAEYTSSDFSAGAAYASLVQYPFCMPILADTGLSQQSLYWEKMLPRKLVFRISVQSTDGTGAGKAVIVYDHDSADMLAVEDCPRALAGYLDRVDIQPGSTAELPVWFWPDVQPIYTGALGDIRDISFGNLWCYCTTGNLSVEVSFDWVIDFSYPTPRKSAATATRMGGDLQFRTPASTTRVRDYRDSDTAFTLSGGTEETALTTCVYDGEAEAVKRLNRMSNMIVQVGKSRPIGGGADIITSKTGKWVTADMAKRQQQYVTTDEDAVANIIQAPEETSLLGQIVDTVGDAISWGVGHVTDIVSAITLLAPLF